MAIFGINSLDFWGVNFIFPTKHVTPQSLTSGWVRGMVSESILPSLLPENEHVP